MQTPLDPVFGLAASFTLGAIFLAGAVDKLNSRELFASVVEAYGLLPVPIVAVFALTVGMAEGLVGCALFVPRLWPLAQHAAFALLALVSVAVVINLVRGRTEISCGCGGSSADQELSWALVLRNVVLAGVLVIPLLPTSGRTLGFADYGTVCFAVVMGFGLYAALNQLLANVPRLASLRS